VSRGPVSSPVEFDEYASTCDAVLVKKVSILGEDKNYFPGRRIEWLRDRFNPIDQPTAAAMQVR
jgi:hypothetical protein